MCFCPVLPTCQQSVVVEASLLVLIRAHVEQVGLDGPVDEVCGEVEQHDAEHHHHDGTDAPQRRVADECCRTETERQTADRCGGNDVLTPSR